MHSVQEQYRDINPVTVNVIGANVTSSLYCGAVHGLDAPGADLVEAFLVELYRCRVCQFTSSLKSSIKTHLLDSHDDLPPAMTSSGFEEEEGEEEEEVAVAVVVVMAEEEEEEEQVAPHAPDPPDRPYLDEHELTSKHSEDDPLDTMGLERSMAFLLPMYGILPSISPRSCDMGLNANCDEGLQVAETCEVRTLFEDEDDDDDDDDEDDEEAEVADEEASVFQLKACSGGSCSEPLARPPGQLDDQQAQSAHLMTLGLCRISKIPGESTPAAPAPAPNLRDKEPPPPPSDALSSGRGGGAGGQQGAARPVCRGGCCRCGRRMRREGKRKSDEVQSCRTCQRSDRNRQPADVHSPDRHSPETHTATSAHNTQAAMKHNTHAVRNSRRRHMSRTRDADTHTDGTANTHACSHEAWLSCVFCDYKDAPVEEPEGCLPTKQTDTQAPPSSHQHARGRGHHGTDSAHPKRTRKRKGSPESHGGQKEKEKKKKDLVEGTGRRDMCCLLCDRKFSSRLTLRRHMGIHQGNKPYSCQLCPYRSRLKASLLQHNRIHTGEKPFRCPAPGCSYASIDRSSLLRHSRTHTQQKPYHCLHCSYSCIQKKSLDLHARRHHTGESFPCQQCPYSSPDRQLLLRHVRRHHPLPIAASP